MQESLNSGARSLLVQRSCGSLWFSAAEDTTQISPVLLIQFSQKTTSKHLDHLLRSHEWCAGMATIKIGRQHCLRKAESPERAPALPCSGYLPPGGGSVASGEDFLNDRSSVDGVLHRPEPGQGASPAHLREGSSGDSLH